MTNTTIKKMVPVNVGGILVVLSDERQAIEALRNISEAFDLEGPFSMANNHAPSGEVCFCGLKDYEHAWWAGWDTEDSEAATAAIRRRH